MTHQTEHVLTDPGDMQAHPARLAVADLSRTDHVHHRDILVPKANSSFGGAPYQYRGTEDACYRSVSIKSIIFDQTYPRKSLAQVE